MAKEVLEMEVKSNIGEVAKDTKKLTTESTKAQKGVGGISKAFKGMGTAIKAAGIGLVVALLAKLMEVFSKNQKVLDVFNTAMTALSIAFNDLFGFISNNIGTVTGYFKELFEDPSVKIKELGTAIKDGLVVRFNEFLEVLGLVGKAFGQLIDGEFSKAFDTIKEAGVQVVDVYTGVDDSLEKITETIVKYTTETLKQADAITQTAKAADRAAVQFAMLNAQFLKDAEIQRQIRDDETKTFEERIEANNKLNTILEEQQKLQREQVQIGIDAAQNQYDINASEENFIALQESKVAMLELEETITGQLSEQKTNQVSLEKELLETQKEVRAEGLLGLELELQELQDAYDLKLEMARKSGMDTTAITKKFEAEKTQIVKSNENLKLAAISGFADSVNKIAGEQKAIAVATALMNTYLGVTEVMKDPTIPSTTMKFLAAGTVLAGGLANVQNILKQDVGSGSGGGGGNVAGSTAPAPQMMSGAFDISGGVAPEATKAYVVTDEMSNSQNQLANIRRRATI
eukprot:GHVR01145070.1.p1 GENE.GHVR01145070.1~~GHVR01145070.1.p1  ORF type:complete len:517 (-),score=123.79 GHVR01145070.1:720-2270(-)